MNGARTAASPLPPAPLPAGSIAARRRVHPDGRIMVNKQPMKLGPRHAGELVTVIIEDTCYRILHGEDVDMRPGLPPASAGGSHPPDQQSGLDPAVTAWRSVGDLDLRVKPACHRWRSASARVSQVRPWTS